MFQDLHLQTKKKRIFVQTKPTKKTTTYKKKQNTVTPIGPVL